MKYYQTLKRGESMTNKEKKASKNMINSKAMVEEAKIWTSILTIFSRTLEARDIISVDNSSNKKLYQNILSQVT